MIAAILISTVTLAVLIDAIATLIATVHEHEES